MTTNLNQGGAGMTRAQVTNENQRRVLRQLEWAEVPMTVSEVASAAFISPSSARTALRSMEKVGLVWQMGVAMGGGRCWAATEATS